MGRTDWSHRPWTTGFYKSPVAGPVFVGRENLAGDAQADLVNHGGADKAICVYSFDHYPFWRETLAESPSEPEPLAPGAFGENFTVAGLAEADVCIGDVWRIADASRPAAAQSNTTLPAALFQVSQPRQPCWKLARRWNITTLPAQVVESGKTGWYFRVHTEGVHTKRIVAAGMELTLVERPCPEWPIQRANAVMYRNEGGEAAAAQLAAIQPLSEAWRTALAPR